MLALPNMFTAGAGHGIGRTLLGKLLFANWAGFRHHISHNPGSLGSAKPPAQLRGILRGAEAMLLGRVVDPVPAQHAVREVFDLGYRAVSWTLAAIHDSHRLSLHRKPPFAPHLLMRQSEEKRLKFGRFFRSIQTSGALADRLAADKSRSRGRWQLCARRGYSL